jgi:hypothetical protein
MNLTDRMHRRNAIRLDGASLGIRAGRGGGEQVPAVGGEEEERGFPCLRIGLASYSTRKPRAG